MHGTLSTAGNIATTTHGRSSGKSAVDDADWFSAAARKLYAHKPGTILHLTTGLGDERLCQRYASGEVRPPAYFLRALLRGDHGQQWLSATMDGSRSEWWRDIDSARALCAQFQIIKRE
jgi:hypothetical protein